jgi:hypothetical protein
MIAASGGQVNARSEMASDRAVAAALQPAFAAPFADRLHASKRTWEVDDRHASSPMSSFQSSVYSAMKSCVSQ